MSEPAHPIVLAFDFTPSAHEALQRAAVLVSRMPIHALHVVCVLEPGRELPANPALEGDPQRAQRAIAELLEVSIKPALKLALLNVYVHVRVGTPASEILAVAREVGAELVLIGSRNTRGHDRFAHGSVAQAVVHGATCSVEVVRARSYPLTTELPETCHPAQVFTYAPTEEVAGAADGRRTPA